MIIVKDRENDYVKINNKTKFNTVQEFVERLDKKFQSDDEIHLAYFPYTVYSVARDSIRPIYTIEFSDIANSFNKLL